MGRGHSGAYIEIRLGGGEVGGPGYEFWSLQKKNQKNYSHGAHNRPKTPFPFKGFFIIINILINFMKFKTLQPSL